MDDRIKMARKIVQGSIQTFSRVEKVFYSSIIVTSLVLAISVVFMQTALLQVQNQMTEVNAQIEKEKTELVDIQQEITELTQSEKMAKVAASHDLSLQNQNLKSATEHKEKSDE